MTKSCARPGLRRRLDPAHRPTGTGLLVLCSDWSPAPVNGAARRRPVRSTSAPARPPGCRPARMIHPASRDARGGPRRGRRRWKAGYTVIESVTPAALIPGTLRLLTGRMQIVRMRAIGHPSPTTPLGDAAFNAEIAVLGLDRLFLHAARIVIPTPSGRLDITAPLPPALACVLERLSVGSPS